MMGSDNLKQLHKWKNASAILKNYPLLVYPRSGFTTEDSDYLKLSEQGRIEVLAAPQLDISATQLREALQTGKSIKYWTPDPVIDYLTDNRLYVD
jgi:nicotinate-nucleotide adenylyltransferase